MADIQHKNITGLDAAHPPFIVSESDPTNTGKPYGGWFKPSTRELKVRDAANSAWLDVVVTGTSTALTAHLSDTSDAHDASAISIADVGTFFTGTNVEAALQELGTGGVTEIDDLTDVDTSTAPPADGQTLIWDDSNSEWIPGSVAAGTVAAADVTYAGGTGMSATNAEAALDELATEKANASDLTDHISDTSAAHAASAISYAGGTGMSATNAEAAIDELATEKANDAALTAHIGDTSDAHDASAISILDTAAQYTATEVEGALTEVLDEVQAHEADTTDAHDASAISIVDSGTYFTSTHVEGALQELGAGGGGGGVADLDDLTDVVITSPATDDVLVYNGSTWVNDAVPGGGGGSGNISGAYDIESGTYTDAGMSDEFASGTLDAKWTTATSSGTIDFPGQPGTSVYDLTTRPGTLLLQPSYSTSAEIVVSLRQADGLAVGESLVMSCAFPHLVKYTATAYQVFGLYLNSSTTSHLTGTWNSINLTVNLSGTNSNAASIRVADNTTGNLRAYATSQGFGERIYLRITRKSVNSTDSFMWFYSLDGIAWNMLWMNTAQAFTQMWIAATQNTQTNPSISSVFPVNWIRHVASTAHDLW